MNKRKRMVSIFAGIMAAIMLLTLILGLLPPLANAASSSEIRKQINALKKELEENEEKQKEVRGQYEENENEILDILARKHVIDQEIQLLTGQIVNINEQISAYNVLIADKQDELDAATLNYRTMNNENLARIRAMEEEGELSYWEVLFKANSFADLLDRLNMVEEIASSDKRRLQELADAADAVELAQDELELEKGELKLVKGELDATQVELDGKMAEADALFQELMEKSDELEAMMEEFEAMEQEFLDEIAQKELEYNEARIAEWEAYMATYVPPTTAPPPTSAGSSGTTGGDTSGGGSTGGSSGGTSSGNTGSSGGGGGWLIPVNYSSITSPFGPRQSPGAGASTYHRGVDLDANTGDAVRATRAGIVVVAGYGQSQGNYVKIDHQDGFASLYYHLSSYSVSAGQFVSAGDYIGAVGNTGISFGDHLHFGIMYNGVYVNPANYVPLY